MMYITKAYTSIHTGKRITLQVLDSKYTHFTHNEVHYTNFALMPEMLKLELLIKTLSSSGTCFSLSKLTVTTSSAVLKATKYPGLPLLILQIRCVTISTKSSNTCMCSVYNHIHGRIIPLKTKLYMDLWETGVMKLNGCSVQKCNDRDEQHRWGVLFQ
jgi:hypothetical protein